MACVSIHDPMSRAGKLRGNNNPSANGTASSGAVATSSVAMQITMPAGVTESLAQLVVATSLGDSSPDSGGDVGGALWFVGALRARSHAR